MRPRAIQSEPHVPAARAARYRRQRLTRRSNGTRSIRCRTYAIDGRCGQDLGCQGLSHLAMIDLHLDDDRHIPEAVEHIAKRRDADAAGPERMIALLHRSIDVRHRPVRALPRFGHRSVRWHSWCGRAWHRDRRQPHRPTRGARPVPARRRRPGAHGRTRPWCSPGRARIPHGVRTRGDVARSKKATT